MSYKKCKILYFHQDKIWPHVVTYLDMMYIMFCTATIKMRRASMHKYIKTSKDVHIAMRVYVCSLCARLAIFFSLLCNFNTMYPRKIFSFFYKDPRKKLSHITYIGLDLSWESFILLFSTSVPLAQERFSHLLPVKIVPQKDFLIIYHSWQCLRKVFSFFCQCRSSTPNFLIFISVVHAYENVFFFYMCTVVITKIGFSNYLLVPV